MKTYPLGDTPTDEERRTFQLGNYPSDFNDCTSPGMFVRAIMTGECRQPNRGDWYLSGAIIHAYRASNALQSSYHIAKLVKIERVMIERVL